MQARVWVALLVATVVALVAGAPVAAAETPRTINFDELTPGTLVTGEYHAQGVDFFTGSIGDNSYCLPQITTAGAGVAQSGDQVADTSCSAAFGDLEFSSIHAELRHSAQHVSVAAGYGATFTGTPPQVAVTLTAYDADDDPVGTSTATVTAGQGTHTPLSVRSAGAN